MVMSSREGKKVIMASVVCLLLKTICKSSLYLFFCLEKTGSATMKCCVSSFSAFIITFPGWRLTPEDLDFRLIEHT